MYVCMFVVCNSCTYMQELSIGAKDMQIFVNGQLLWQGTINKVSVCL